MQIPVLIEPKDGGGFRATAGEPFRMSADAESEQDAARQLEAMVRARLKGTRLAFLDLANGPKSSMETPLRFDPIPGEDWVFGAMREAIEEERRRENEAEG